MEYYIVPTNLKESSIVLQQYFTIQKRKTNSDILQATHTTSSALLQVLCLSMESEGSHNHVSRESTEDKWTRAYPLGDIQWTTFKVYSPGERGNSYYTENEISQS